MRRLLWIKPYQMWTHVSSLRDKQIAGLATSDKRLGWGKDVYNNSHQVITGVVFPNR